MYGQRRFFVTVPFPVSSISKQTKPDDRIVIVIDSFLLLLVEHSSQYFFPFFILTFFFVVVHNIAWDRFDCCGGDGSPRYETKESVTLHHCASFNQIGKRGQIRGEGDR